MVPVSARLHNAGFVISRIAKLVEDSQVEDGDPPFEIEAAEYRKLSAAGQDVLEILKEFTPK